MKQRLKLPQGNQPINWNRGTDSGGAFHQRLVELDPKGEAMPHILGSWIRHDKVILDFDRE